MSYMITRYRWVSGLLRGVMRQDKVFRSRLDTYCMQSDD